MQAATAQPDTIVERPAEAFYFGLESAHQQELFRRGLARPKDGFWRYAFWGAVRLSLGTAWAQATCSKYLSRIKLKRPGEDGYVPRHAPPENLIDEPGA